MIINVLVEVNVNKQNQLFSYIVPSFLIDKIKLGIRVLVPFGNKILEGFVLNIESGNQKYDYELKSIVNVVDEEPVLNEEMIELGKYMSEYYLAPLINCYQVMLPVALKAKQKVNIRIKEEKYIVLNQPRYEIEEWIEKLKSQKQKDILLELLDNNYIKKVNINSISSLNSLIKKHLVKEVRKEVYRLNDHNLNKDKKPTLTDDQKKVIKEIIDGNDDVYLLHGVTGSGKTEVYINVIEEMIKKKKTAIVLVPEISLTTQLVDNFKNRFGSKVAILHSRLSDGERYDEWRKIVRGEVSIVIGARSAIFAPLKHIGVIIIDEEHEATYKQENNPRYNAIEIALYRVKNHHAKVILGSATPSLESYARAKKGIYKLLELKNRINQKPLPKVIIVDMKNSIKKGHHFFSEELINKIKERLEKKEQIMILLNRRGYANYITCKNCGYTYKCPHCDITLTYHKTSDTMRCHYCGYADKRHEICPKCHEKDLTSFGIGTERVEEELIKIFPDIRIVRMDLDTTSNKGAHDKIIRDFNNYQYDLLLGTQMIAKGLDFPKVTLVGILNGDMGLNIPDFRSGERTYQLLSQVAGRSGRSDIQGEVVLQTFNDDHYVIEMAQKHNYEGFYTREMDIRRKLKYPPYCFISLVGILSKNFDEGLKEAQKIGNYLRKNLPNNMVLGPTIANISKINNIYRFQCLIKYRKQEEVYNTLKEVQSHYENNHKIRLEIDFNPLKL